ncbi:MAG TPA: peptidylprolyl isomerase, partial [Chitinophagaceae bacterium]|nr:peptidylprolyl isomerase [Chitinophagaceae bacterium]
SNVDNDLLDYRRQFPDAEMPQDSSCYFLQGELIQKTLVLQAEKDSIVIDDAEIDAKLDNQIRYFIKAYGSQEILEQIAGKTIYQIKEDQRQPFKEKELADQMRNKIVNNVKVTPTEVKEYFDKIPKDSLRYYESQVEVAQIIIYPKSNKDVEEYVTAQLNDLKHQVETGKKKFDALARIYSQDPGSKDNGGQYSMNRNDKIWDPTFLAAAFKLKEGQISPVIKSKFGLHIIQMVSRAGDDAIIRHILIIPPVTDAEVKESLAKMDSIKTQIKKGTISFTSAVNKFSEDEASKFTGGWILAEDGSTYISIDQLDKDAVVALKNMKVSDVSEPFVYTDERQRKAVRILFLKTRTEPHIENTKDDYNKIADRALEVKREQTLEKWFKDHIPNYFINIDQEYQGCSVLSEFIEAQKKAVAH